MTSLPIVAQTISLIKQSPAPLLTQAPVLYGLLNGLLHNLTPSGFHGFEYCVHLDALLCDIGQALAAQSVPCQPG